MTQMLIETYQMFFKLVLVYPEHVHHLALNLVAVSHFKRQLPLSHCWGVDGCSTDRASLLWTLYRPNTELIYFLLLQGPLFREWILSKVLSGEQACHRAPKFAKLHVSTLVLLLRECKGVRSGEVGRRGQREGCGQQMGGIPFVKLFIRHWPFPLMPICSIYCNTLNESFWNVTIRAALNISLWKTSSKQQSRSPAQTPLWVSGKPAIDGLCTNTWLCTNTMSFFFSIWVCLQVCLFVSVGIKFDQLSSSI